MPPMTDVRDSIIVSAADRWLAGCSCLLGTSSTNWKRSYHLI